MTLQPLLHGWNMQCLSTCVQQQMEQSSICNFLIHASSMIMCAMLNFVQIPMVPSEWTVMSHFFLFAGWRFHLFIKISQNIWLKDLSRHEWFPDDASYYSDALTLLLCHYYVDTSGWFDRGWFYTGICVPLRMNCNSFGYFLTYGTNIRIIFCCILTNTLPAEVMIFQTASAILWVWC